MEFCLYGIGVSGVEMHAMKLEIDKVRYGMTAKDMKTESDVKRVM